MSEDTQRIISRLVMVGILTLIVFGLWSVYRSKLVPAVTSPVPITEEETPVPTVATYTDPDYGFSLATPDDFIVIRDIESVPWESDVFADIPPRVRIAVPDSWREKTNLVEGVIDILATTQKAIVAKCTSVPSDYTLQGKKEISGIQYSVSSYRGAAAGNLYDVTSYRGTVGDLCIVADIALHSSNIGNYDPESGIKEFDRKKIFGALEGILTTIQFKE